MSDHPRPRHVRATLSAPLWLPGLLGIAGLLLFALTILGHVLRALGGDAVTRSADVSAVRLETVELLAAAAPWPEAAAWLRGVHILLKATAAEAALAAEERGLERARDAGWLADPLPVVPPPAEAAAQPEAIVPEAPAAPPAAAPEAAPQSGESIKTPERSELLRQLWPNPTLSVGQILLRLNALPGKPIQTPPTLYGWAKALGLPSTRTSQPGFAAEVPPPAARKPIPEPATPPAAPAAPPPERNREEQAAEARRLRKEGNTPEAIARRTGLPMDDVRALQAAAEQTAREMIELGTDTDQVVIEAGLPPARVRALRDELRVAKRAATAA